MELITFDYNKTYTLPKLVLALGHFDGLHLAHQELIKKTVELATTNNIKSAVITFDPHPDYVLKKRAPTGYITPMKDKIAIFTTLGVDYLIIVPFTIKLSKMLSNEFEEIILGKFDIERIVIGFDYRYGYKGQGTKDTLKERYPIYVMKEITYKDEKIGSSLIRDMLINGEVEIVHKLLGQYYYINGEIVSKERLSKASNFLVVKVSFSVDYHILKAGIYASIITLDKNRLLGLTYYHINTSLNNQVDAQLEVYITDLLNNIYNKDIKIEFIKQLQTENNYLNKKDLLTQISQNIEKLKLLKVDL